MLRDQRLEDADGLRPFSLLHQRQPEAVAARPPTRIERAGAPKVLDGAVEIAPGLQRDAELQVRGRESRREPDGFAELRNRVVEPSELAERGAEVVARLGVARRRCARPRAADLRRLRDRASTSGSRRGGTARSNKAGIELHRALELGQRLGDAILPAQREPELVVRAALDGRARTARSYMPVAAVEIAAASRTSPSASSASNASGFCATSRSRACCADSSLPADACCRASRTTAATSRAGGAGA